MFVYSNKDGCYGFVTDYSSLEKILFNDSKNIEEVNIYQHHKGNRMMKCNLVAINLRTLIIH